MSTEKIESTDELRRARLSRGTTISGVIGVIKLLLVLAPFALVRSCGGTTQMTFLDVTMLSLAIAHLTPLLFIILLVPLSALIAVEIPMMSFIMKQGAPRDLGQAKVTLAFSAVSLAALLLLAALDTNGGGELLWGAWGLIAADVATIILLTVVIRWPERRET